MYQRDYLLRMIEMIADLIVGILGLIKKGEFQQASQSLDAAYYDFLKQDASLFRSIDKEKLSDELLSVHNYTNGHLEILSELFYAEAELLYAQGQQSKSIEFYEKTLVLYEFVNKESKTFSFDKELKISLIRNRIDQLKKEDS